MIKKILITLFSLSACINLLAQTTDHTFSYQGELFDDAVLANDSYDIAIQAFETDTGSNNLTALIEYTPVKVKNGVFNLDNVELDPSVFQEPEVWLEISVRQSSDGGNYSPLSPRQKLKAVPYATTLIDGNAQEGQILTFTSSGWIPDYNIHFSGDYSNLTGKPAIPDAATGLEQVTENGIVGFRLIGDTGASIGFHAIQLSTNNGQNTNGPTGFKAFTTGNATLASGGASTAMGGSTVASGDVSTAMGQFSEARGLASTALGDSTIASGESSIATGFQTHAIHHYSAAFGFITNASGIASTAFGIKTIAQSYNSTATGRYNIGLGSKNSWVDTDPLFEIGNGDSSTRNNAFTVLKNGQTGIGTHQPSVDLEVNATSDGDALLVKIDNSKKFFVDVNGGTSVGSVFSPPSNGLRVDGDVKQPITSNGLIKYMVHAYCSNNASTVDIIKSYNGVSSDAITIAVGESSNISLGTCEITFPESIADRYWQSNAVSYGARGTSCSLKSTNSNTLQCARSDLHNSTTIDGPIMILIY